ncbi:type II toxin-antitoxin system RelE/ParE family toxin [Nitrosococcus watsonii]|uniref:Plasmid maintenance system killer n=1 Tax=Nitrosococcus watsoni (strain C-113) TaxID=105559 RepID=D8KCG4_NITWC|nr:type II toxin-antitoxin system RelE/ParE family toxin [Nitrosococcus watsonii]ADJ29905.1 plasmid maintenance system killer [Nitrosococcus watsonii C-113]
MIENFKDRRLKRLYERADRSKIQADLVDKVERILARLEQALVIEDMDLPGYRLHSLKGDLKGFWSVSISGNWRVIFRFENGKARDVEMIDYH